MTTPSEPSRAERARTLAEAGRLGVLATVARKPAGYPYASLTPFALDDAGRPLLVISQLAEHTRNLCEDARCSLLVTEPGDEAQGVLARGRLTVLGRAQRIEAPALAQAAVARFVERHPQASTWARFGDFHPWCLEVEAARWIGGFGRMSWIDAGAWRAATPDPLAPHAADVIEHMNVDHADALVAMVRAFADASEVGHVAMTALDRYGFEVELAAQASDEARTVRLAFERPLTTALEVRNAMVKLVKRARAQLGEV